MNHILKKDIIQDKNYKIISHQFNKIISFNRRSSSAERKSLRILKHSDYHKHSSNSKRIIFTNNSRFLENNFCSKNSRSLINIHRPSDKINDIKIIKDKNITDINKIFKSKDKAKTFNKPYNNDIKESENNINKYKSNIVTINNVLKIKNEKYKNNREIYKKKFVIENPTLSINDMNKINNQTSTAKSKILIRNNSGFNLSINDNKSNSKRNTDISPQKNISNDVFININNNEIKNARKAKFKNKVKNKNNSKELIINNNEPNILKLNNTINTKIKKLSEIQNIQDLKQKIIICNSFKKNLSNKIGENNKSNKNANTNFNSLLKQRKKNIDINTEFQMNPIIHIYSMDKSSMNLNNKMSNRDNVIIFNNTTTNKVKSKLFDFNNEKDSIRFTENIITINKTKSKAKVKYPEIKKESTDIKSKIKNDNIIKNDSKVKNNLINNNSTKVKKSQNEQKNNINDINRNNTYNNDSFLTININSTNIDENNNNETKHNLVNYCFVSNINDKEQMSNINNNTINSKNSKKINKFNLLRKDSNSNNKTNNSEISNAYENSSVDNFLNLNNKRNTFNVKINKPKEIEEENIKLTNEVKSINIKQSMNNKNNNNNNNELLNKDNNVDIKEILNKEIIENNIDEKGENKNININIPNNIEEIKKKDTFLDKSTSIVVQAPQEDFIDKDDEVMHLLNPLEQKDALNNINNNNNNANLNDDESDIILQNSEFSIVNNNNYIVNNQNFYQNININIIQPGKSMNSLNMNNLNQKNNNTNNNINNNNNQNINLNNTTLRDISISSNFGIRASKSITQAGKERTGHRKKNQDNFIIEKNINNILEFNIFSVLDGHGDNGHIVSQLAGKYLIKKFSLITKDYMDVESIYNFLKNSDFQKIIDIFIETDKEIISQKKFDVSLSGSTCVFVIQLGDHIICANIGDSRAILVYEENSQNKIFELSHDSKPDVPEEKKRIELIGGIVDQVKDENGERTGPFRVFMKNMEQPGLAMSRSFGDKKAKSCGVIPYPDIIEYNLKYNFKYMVICSDGVWEFMSNEDVKEIGDKYFYQNDINELCNQLLKKSTEIWEHEENYMDDITIVAVFF